MLVHPVTEAGVTEVSVLLPGKGEVWYHLETLQRFNGDQILLTSVTLDNIPVYQRGGTIIPRKTSVGRSTKHMETTSYSLHVALSSENTATGKLFIDDGHSFNYQSKNQFLLRKFSVKDNTFSAVCADERGWYCTECLVEKIHIVGAGQPYCVTTLGPDMQEIPVQFNYNLEKCLLIIENLQFNVGCDWTLRLKY